MAASNEKVNLSSEAECGYLRNKKGKFASKKSVENSVLSVNKMTQAKKSAKKRRFEDDAQEPAINDFIARKKQTNKTVEFGT